MVVIREEGDKIFIESSSKYSVINLELYECKMVNDKW